jgi:hypothetical protein
MNIEGPTPALFGYIKESAWCRRTCGVHKNIDSAPEGTGLGDSTGATFNATDVCLDVKCVISIRCCSRLKRFE